MPELAGGFLNVQRLPSTGTQRVLAPPMRHRVAIPVVLVSLVLLLLPLGEAADAAYQVSLAPPSTVVSPPGGASDATSVSLSDGRAVVAYWHTVGSGLTLSAVVVEESGATLAEPVDLTSSASGQFPISLADNHQGGAAVLWAVGGSAFITFYDGTAFSVPTAIDLGPFAAWACALSGGGGTYVAACDSSLASNPADSKQIRMASLSPGSSTPTAPLALVPPTSSGNRVIAIAGDGSGDTWVAYMTPTPGTSQHLDAYVVALDGSGNVSFAPSRVIDATDSNVPIALAASKDHPSSMRIAIGEPSPASSNAEVKVLELSKGPARAITPALFSSSPGLLVGLAVAAVPFEGKQTLLVEWSENRPTDHDSTGQAHPRPVLALIDDDLNSLAVPIALGPMDGGHLSFAGGSGDVVEFGGPVLIHRLALSRAPAAASEPSPPPPATSDALVIVLAIAAIGGTTTLWLATLSDRVKWLLLVGVWPLYVAVRRDRVLLDNMRRGAILQVVTDDPGIRLTELSRRTGIGLAPLRHHVSLLEDFGFLSRDSNRHAVRFYLAGKNPIREQPFQEIREQILDEIRKAPGLSHSELARRVGVKWTTLLYHTEILEGSGAVRAKRERRTRRYWPGETR